jgi:hypothetical protein
MPTPSTTTMKQTKFANIPWLTVTIEFDDAAGAIAFLGEVDDGDRDYRIVRASVDGMSATERGRLIDRAAELGGVVVESIVVYEIARHSVLIGKKTYGRWGSRDFADFLATRVIEKHLGGLVSVTPIVLVAAAVRVSEAA